MGGAVERKFTVVGTQWRSLGHPISIRQGYVSRDEARVVRLRTADGKGLLTLTSISNGLAGPEFAYEIPLDEAEQMLRELCIPPLIEKTRYHILHKDLIWQVDEFQSPRPGLVIAELEIPYADYYFEVPYWVGEDVTSDPNYYDRNMT